MLEKEYAYHIVNGTNDTFRFVVLLRSVRARDMEDDAMV